MNTENHADRTGGKNRRSFLNGLWVFIGVIASIEIGWIGSSILRARKTRSTAGSVRKIVDAGSIDEFNPGTVTPVPEGKFYLARLDDGSFIALSRNCTHLGCSVPWDDKEKKFICPCHGSTFNLKGEALTPPATRPLDYYPIRIENGIVRVFASSAKRRGAFQPEQSVGI